jgi:hypothetical protein
LVRLRANQGGLSMANERRPSSAIASSPLLGSAIAALSLSVVLFAVPLAALASVESPRLSPALYWVMLIIAYSAARLAQIAVSQHRQIVATGFWMFVYVFLGIAPACQIAAATFPWQGQYDDASLTRTSVLIVLGLVGFEFGRVMCVRHKWTPGGAVLARQIKATTVMALTLPALASAALFWNRLGGSDAFLTSRMERSVYLADRFATSEMLLMSQLAGSPVFVLFIALLVTAIARRSETFWSKRSIVLASIVLGAVTVIVNNPLSSPRLIVGTIVLSVWFVLPWRRWSGVITVIALVVGLVVIFPFADLFRSSLETRLGERVAGVSLVDELTRKGDYDSFQQVANALEVTDRNGIQAGAQIAGAFLFWFPRSVWPEKPRATGEFIPVSLGYDFTNLSAPLWAEFLVDGGPLLLFLGFCAYGVFAAVLDGALQSAARADAVTVASVLVPIYAGYQFFLLRGSLMPAFAYFAPIILVVLICSTRRGSGYAPPPTSMSMGAHTGTR